jgi:hypothetical protein
MVNMDSLILEIISIVIGTIILAPILWLVGKSLVGREKAKFTDALLIMFLGQAIGGVVGFIFSYLYEGFTIRVVAFIVQLIVWLGLIKHFFDTGWGKAFVIAIIAVIVAAIIFALLAFILIGLGLLALTLF